MSVCPGRSTQDDALRGGTSPAQQAAGHRPTGGRAGSSRWRPTRARRTRPATPIAGRPPRNQVMYGRPATSTCTSATACTGAPTWLRARRRGAGGPAAGPRTGGRPGADAPGPLAPQRRQDDRDLCRGPGRLCQASGSTRLRRGRPHRARGRPVWLADDGDRGAPESRPLVTGRIGISVGPTGRGGSWWTITRARDEPLRSAGRRRHRRRPTSDRDPARPSRPPGRPGSEPSVLDKGRLDTRDAAGTLSKPPRKRALVTIRANVG